MRIPKKAVAQLVFEGAVPSYSSCANVYSNLLMKEVNDTESRKTFIQGKNKAKGRLWKLIIIAEEPEDITAVVMRCTKNFLHNVAKQMH